MEVSSGNNEEVEDENKGPSLPKYPCTIPYCNCQCHNNNPPAPPPPPATGAYYGDGSTQFANWEQYQEVDIVFARCRVSICCLLELPKACQVQSSTSLPFCSTGPHMPFHVLCVLNYVKQYSICVERCGRHKTHRVVISRCKAASASFNRALDSTMK